MTLRLSGMLVAVLVAAMTIAAPALGLPEAAGAPPSVAHLASSSASHGASTSAGTSAPTEAAALAASLATGGSTPASAVAAGASAAAARGVTQYISVVARNTGSVLAETSNARQQVGSESIMKLFLAAYYIVLYGGYTQTPSSVLDRLSYMLRYSDDSTASSLFTSSAIPTVAARYGLSATTNATDRPGHWGAARITAHDMTQFLYRAAHDSAVGPWLVPVMAQTNAYGSDGFDQHFGLNALSGVHGSKQGWGDDSFWTTQSNAIHSVGYTDKYFVAVLQLSYSYPDPARSTATASAQLIQSAGSGPPPDGSFVRLSGSSTIFRIVGGAPIRVNSWAAVGGAQSVTTIDAATWNALRTVPTDGTFIRSGTTGTIFRIAGGAPIRVASWTTVGGEHAYTIVDPLAITNAGATGDWKHLNALPTDGTFIRSGTTGTIFRIAGGAPIRVASWTTVGGEHAYTIVDPAAITNAGATGDWKHLNALPTDGTFIRSGTTGTIFRIAGGAPIRVASWTTVGGEHAYTIVDPAAITNAGATGDWKHLNALPTDGTFIRSGTTGTIFRIAGGAPIRVASWTTVGGEHAYTIVDPAAITNAGATGDWKHLNALPTDGTFIRSGTTGTIFRIAGGAPIRVASWTTVGGEHAYTIVDPAAITNAGATGDWKHLNALPTDGTFIRSGTTGFVYRIAGGAPLYMSAWSALGGYHAYTIVDPAAITNAGATGDWKHLRVVPADGTFLEGMPGSQIYRVAAGHATLVKSWTAYGGPHPTVMVNQATIDRAGGGGPYNHLKK